MAFPPIGQHLRNGAGALVVAALLAGCGGKSADELVASAGDYLSRGDHNAAVIQLRSALTENPKHAQARFRLGQLLLESGDAPTAEKELRRAREYGYEPDAQITPLLARALAEQGQFEKLVSEFGRSELADAEGSAALQTHLGTAYLGLGRKDDARKALAAAQAVRPDFPQAMVLAAKIKASEGDIAAARQALDQALTAAPKLTDAMLLRAEIETSQADNQEAAKWYRRVIEQNPEHVQARFHLALLAFRDGELSLAKEQLAGLQKAAPQHPLTHYVRALVSYRERDIAAAREAIQKALRGGPNHLPFLQLSGVIELESKNYETAEQQLLKVVEKSPGATLARRALATLYLTTGQTDKAMDTVKPLLASAGDDTTTLQLAAQIHARAGDPAGAAALLEKAVAASPSDTQARIRLAMARFAQGDARKAFAELEAASAADKSQTSADAVRVLAHVGRKEFDKAAQVLDEMERKQPDDPLTHDLRAGYHMARGDKAKARASLEQALKARPDHTQSLMALARMDVQDEQPAAAARRIEEILKTDPKNVRALLALAAVKQRMDAPPEEIRKLHERAITAEPADATPRLALIDHLLRRRDLKGAVQAAQEAAAALPKDARVLEASGRVQLLAGMSNQALQSFTRMSALAPGATRPFLLMAQAQVAEKDDKGARDSLNKALAIEPDLVEAHIAVARIETQRQNYADALVAARRVQALRAQDIAGFLLEGDIHVMQAKWDEAIAAYRSAFKLGEAADALTHLHSALSYAGKSAEAQSLVADWLKTHPRDTRVRAYLAQRLLASGRLDQAARAYEELVALAPGDVLPLNNLAWTKAQLKDPKAIEYAERAAALAPDNAAVLDTLGWLLAQKGERARALDLLRRASTLAPDAHDIRLHFAQSLLETGDKGAARKELQTLSRLGERYPRQDEVAALLARQ